MNIRNFRYEEDPFIKNAKSISKIYHEVFLLMKFLQTKHQIKNMNIYYYEIFYTVNKIRDEKELVNGQYEDNENDFINFNEFVTANRYIGIKPRETRLR